MCQGSFIQYVREIFRKTNISYSLIRTHTRTCAYQGVRSVSFSENFPLMYFDKCVYASFYRCVLSVCVYVCVCVCARACVCGACVCVCVCVCVYWGVGVFLSFSQCFFVLFLLWNLALNYFWFNTIFVEEESK